MPWDLAYLEQGWADAVILPPGVRISMRGSMIAKCKGGRARREGLVPRWMAFPPSNYTARCGVGTVAAHAMAFAALEREGPAENESEAEDETGAEGEAVGGPEIEGGTETGPETEAAESGKQASDVAGFGAPEADSGEVEATDGKSPEPSASGLFLTEGAEISAAGPRPERRYPAANTKSSLPAAGRPGPLREHDNDTMRGRAITELHSIEKLVTRFSPEPVCDDRITQTLGLSPLENADHAARELAGSNGFERRKATCSLCGEIRLVTKRH